MTGSDSYLNGFFFFAINDSTTASSYKTSDPVTHGEVFKGGAVLRRCHRYEHFGPASTEHSVTLIVNDQYTLIYLFEKNNNPVPVPP